MNNKLLSYSGLAISALTLVLVGVLVFGSPSKGVLGGMTNFDSLTLKPETASDNALVVNNSGGTAQLTVYGSGGLLISGTSTNSGATTNSGTVTQSGALNVTGMLTVTGETKFDSLKSGYASQSGSATTTAITAATLCDVGLVEWTPSVANATATLPDAVPLQADCLDARGASNYIFFENLSNAASTTLFAAGASSTIELVISSSTAQSGKTLPGGDGAKIEAIYSTSTTSNSAMVKYKITIFED